MASDPQVTQEQLAQERSIRFALLADLGVLALFVPVGLLGGSLTIKAEAIRFVLMMSIEILPTRSCDGCIAASCMTSSSAAASWSRSPIS